MAVGVFQRARLTVLLVVACLIVAVWVPAPVRATTPTTTTLTVSNLKPNRGDEVTYTVTVDLGIGVGTVAIESSADGVTWVQEEVLSVWSNATTMHSTQTIDASVPLGVRHLRAHFDGINDLDPSTSDPVDQTIGIRQTSISGLSVSSSHAVLVPGTTPLQILCYVSGGGGIVVFEQQNGASWDELGRTSVTYSPYGGTGAWIYVTGFALGTHEIRASLLENPYAQPSEQTISFTMTKANANPTISGPTSVQAHHPVELSAGLENPDTGVLPTGDVTLLDADTNIALASGPSWQTYSVGSLPLGPHHFSVTYPGDANYESGTGALTLTIVPDIVEASGVTVSPTTFYPYRDGYRDTASITGNRNEALTVSIRILSPGGSTVRLVTLARASGRYAYAWNGRTSSGSLLPAGTYRVVQTLSDDYGTTKSVSTYVNLSTKRLIYHTVYVTKYGSSVSAKGDQGTGSISISTTGHWAKLVGHYPSGPVGVGYQFTIPAAVVYSRIAFQVYAKAPYTAPANQMALQNFRICPLASGTWYVNCFDRWHSLGSDRSVAWFSASGSTLANRSGRSVRGMVWVNFGTVYVYKARARVVYATLG